MGEGESKEVLAVVERDEEDETEGKGGGGVSDTDTDIRDEDEGELEDDVCNADEEKRGEVKRDSREVFLI